jgi:hypothetical protein
MMPQRTHANQRHGLTATVRELTLRCGRLSRRLGTQVDQLAKQAAELALRLAALPADGLRNDREALDAIEELAVRILQEVAYARNGNSLPVGETRGLWPAIQPARRH